MRTDDLTPGDMTRFMLELSTNFGGKKDLEGKGDLWLKHFERYPLGIMRRVVDRLLAEDSKYFPTLGHALAIAKELTPDDTWRDDSPRSRYRRWEENPWATVITLDRDRRDCTSAPCPICQSVIQFSDRGAVIVHDQLRHKEGGVPYSNIGRPEWFDLGPTPEPARKQGPQLPPPRWRTLPEPTTGPTALNQAIQETQAAVLAEGSPQ